MIADVTQWICDRLAKIKHGDTPLPVFSPGPDREKGETPYPHVSVRLTDWEIDRELYRPHAEVLIPSEETVTVNVPADLAGKLHAVVESSKQEPYQITEGVNDSLSLRLGIGNDWDDPSLWSLIAGSRDAWEVARSINVAQAFQPVIVAEFTDDGRLRLLSREPGMDLEILECPNSAYATLGLTVGVVSHLARTGPASYGVTPAPIPVRLEYVVEIGAADQKQQRAVEFWALHAIRDGHWPIITGASGNGFAPVFQVGKVALEEHGERPEYATAIRYVVSQVWLEYPADYEVLGITDFTLEFEPSAGGET